MRLGCPDERDLIPGYFHEVVWPEGQLLFASAVYVHGSTAVDDIGLTLTLAHELQHFVQATNTPNAMETHRILKDLPALRANPGTLWSDFPMEREARIVAKQVAEEIHGDHDVKQNLAKRVRDHDADAKDWQFVSGIDTSCPYDAIVETKLMAEKYGFSYPAETAHQ